MNLTIEVQDNFKTILIKSDSATANTDYPVVQVYVNNTLTYTLVVGGSATLGSTTYTTTSGADNLDFASTITTTGTKYIHTVTVDTLSTSSNLVLTDGVWSFKFLNTSGATAFHLGVVIHDEIDECIMEHLDPLCDGTCSIDKLIDKANRIYGLLYSAKVSATKAEFTNAQCKYNMASTLCSDCNV